MVLCYLWMGVEWNPRNFMGFPWVKPLNNSRAFEGFRVKNAKMLCNVLITMVYCKSLPRKP
jgi:hypothetical protein